MNGNYSSLTTLAQEIERIENSKADFLAKGESLRMIDDSRIAIAGIGDYSLNNYSHGQVAEKMGIPKKYYDMIGTIPGLRTINVNELLRSKAESGYMVRTLDGNARALVSNAFRPIDHYDVLSSVLPVIKELDIEIKSCSMTDMRMYVQIVSKRMQKEVKKGDVVQWGFTLSNSEVGAGSVDLKTLVWRCWCSNGAIGESIMRKYHIGSKLDAEMADIYSDDTVQAELQSFKLRLRDVLADAMSERRFIMECEKIDGAIADKVSKVTETVQNITKRFGLRESYNDLIIENMVQDGNLNRYGIANGITFLAHSIESPDEQYEVEKIGSQVINMTRNEFNKYVAA